MKDYSQGVLESLVYSLALLRREKRPNASAAKIAEEILEILEASAEDLEFRMSATA